MGRVTQSMESESLGLRIQDPSNVRVSDDFIQTLTLLLGYNDAKRVLLRASPNGILFTSSPRLVDVFHWTATTANAAKQGDNIPCTEVLCMGHPSNGDTVWVRTRKTATVDNAIPLAKNDVMVFSVNNLNELYALIVADTERLIVGYTL